MDFQEDRAVCERADVPTYPRLELHKTELHIYVPYSRCMWTHICPRAGEAICVMYDVSKRVRGSMESFVGGSTA